MNIKQIEEITFAPIVVGNLRPNVNRFVYELIRHLHPFIGKKLSHLSLAPKELIAYAEESTELTDWNGDNKKIIDALERLTSPRNDYAQLTRFGCMVFKKILADRLCNRLRIINYVKQNPEIKQEKIERPLFIVGLPRTGTSYLQQMLSSAPNCLPLQSWYTDQITPSPSLTPNRFDLKKLKQHINAFCFNTLMPEFRNIHKISPSGVDECLPLLMNTMMTDAFGLFADLPEYSDWLESEEMSDSYQFYHLQLQVLQRHMPQGYWVLKSPAHLPNINEIYSTFPDANIVHIHRDPRKSIPSLLSLRFKIMGLFNDYSTHAGEHLIRQSLKTAIKTINKVTEERSKWNNQQMLDIQYTDFIKNPQAVCCQTLEHFGYETGSVFANRLASKVRAAEKYKKNGHKYSLDMFGLQPQTIDVLFDNYCSQFGVIREQIG